MSIYLSFDLIDEIPENAVYTGEGKSWVLEGYVPLNDGSRVPICRRIEYSRWYLPDENKEVAFQLYIISRQTEADIRRFYKDEL